MPTKYKSLMSLKKRRTVHNVAMYNDNTGYGTTSCGIRVLPSDVTATGIVNCRPCKSHMDGSWLKKMAKLEEGCDVAAGGSLEMKAPKRLARVCANAHRHDICAVPWCECRCHKKGRYVLVKGNWVFRKAKA